MKLRERENFIHQSKYTIPVEPIIRQLHLAASRRDNPSSWLPVAMITVRLKVYEEKKELSNKHPHIMQNTNIQWHNKDNSVFKSVTTTFWSQD